MIRVRQVQQRDAEYLKRFVEQGDISQKDAIFIAEGKESHAGLVAVRPLLLVHDLFVETGIVQRRTADLLLTYAKAYAKASGHNEALFTVDPKNQKMIRWIEEHGARLEDTAQIYTMDVE